MKPFPLSNRSVQLLLVFIMVFLQSCAACRSGLRGGFEQHDLQGSDEDNLFAYSIEFPDGFRVEHDGDRPPKGKGELLSAVARITNTNIGSSVETHVTPLMGLVNSTTGESLVDDAGKYYNHHRWFRGPSSLRAGKKRGINYHHTGRYRFSDWLRPRKLGGLSRDQPTAKVCAVPVN